MHVRTIQEEIRRRKIEDQYRILLKEEFELSTTN